MGGTTKALNYARIVHRLLTDPRGWEVEDLREKLNIGDRAYRKYRLELQNEFSPYLGEHIQVVEVSEEGYRWLRLSQPITVGGLAAAQFAKRFRFPETDSKWSAIFFATVHSQRLKIETEEGEGIVEPLTLIVEKSGFAVVARVEGAVQRIDGRLIKNALRVEERFDYPPISQYDPAKFLSSA